MLVSFDAVEAAKNYAKKGSGDFEVLGLFLGTDELLNKFIEIDNLASNPEATYLAHPQQLFDALKVTDVIAPGSSKKVMFFHSHPKWKAYPSVADRMGAGFIGYYSIYSLTDDELNVFYFNGKDFSEKKCTY